MEAKDLLVDAYDRITQTVHRSAEGLSAAALAYRPDPDANSIAWLVWHLTRVQDDHVSELAGGEQAWVADGWAGRFGREADPNDTGYGHTSEQVAGIAPAGPDALLGYHDAVAARSQAYLGILTAADLDEVIDRSYDPPVTRAVRLVSVISDNIQHAGQAAYVRGIAERAGVS